MSAPLAMASQVRPCTTRSSWDAPRPAQNRSRSLCRPPAQLASPCRGRPATARCLPRARDSTSCTSSSRTSQSQAQSHLPPMCAPRCCISPLKLNLLAQGSLPPCQPCQQWPIPAEPLTCAAGPRCLHQWPVPQPALHRASAVAEPVRLRGKRPRRGGRLYHGLPARSRVAPRRRLFRQRRRHRCRRLGVRRHGGVPDLLRRTGRAVLGHQLPRDGARSGWLSSHMAPQIPVAKRTLTVGWLVPLQARLGRCAAPYIRVQDWSRRTVTQHCASQCGGCSGRPTPRLADSMAPPDQYCCAFAAGAYYAGPNGTAAAA